jgi:hypothetical protein
MASPAAVVTMTPPLSPSPPVCFTDATALPMRMSSPAAIAAVIAP